MPFAPPTSSFRDVVRRLIPRRTYTVSQTRAVAVGALALVSLLATTLLAHAYLFPGPAHHQHLHRQQRAYHAQLYSHHHAHHARVPMRPSGFSFAQHPGEELGALVAFLGALASNSLPLDTNPHSFLDPDLVLDFDTRSTDEGKVVREVLEAVSDAWARHPVVIFSEFSSSSSPASREMKGIFAALDVNPSPTIFEVDKRVDAKVLRPLVQRLTRLSQLPVVLVGGKPMMLNEVRAERDAGTLKERVLQAGAVEIAKKHTRQL